MAARAAVVFTGASACLLALPALRAPAAEASRPGTTAGLPLAGLWGRAPSARINTVLRRQTGFSSLQLASKPACETPHAGTMSCRADLLVVRASGQPVRLLHRPHRTGTTVIFIHRRAGTGGPKSVSSDAFANSTGISAPAASTPAYLQWAYDLTGLSETSGTGDTVAIVDAYDDPDALPDLATFRQQYGLWPCTDTATVSACQTAISSNGVFEQYNQDGALIDQSGSGVAPATDSTGGWETEESLDVDSVSSLCPNCTLVLVEADSSSDSDLSTAVNDAYTLGAQQVSMSWGDNYNEGCDKVTWWAAGQASVAAAGDSGYQGVSTNYGGSCSATPASGSVSYPAADNQVTAVGGTSLTTSDTPRGFTESVWNDGYVSSAGSYYATQSGCDTSQLTPVYQAGITTDCSGRAYNDIAADADPLTGLDVYDTFGGSAGCSTWCVVGGTSMATPLTAAYEALAGVTPTDSPAWAYSDAADLNDITTGTDDTNNTCPRSELVICQAQTGWDGPTGNGSLSGALYGADGTAYAGLQTAPGIGGAYAQAPTPSTSNLVTAAVAGGVYPNAPASGESTDYWWQYGTGSAYGQTDDGTGTLSGTALQPVSGSLSGLTPCVTYHYRLDATNSAGTAYGYDNTLVSAPPQPVPTTAPSASGSAMQGDPLTGQAGGWSTVPAPCLETVSYQWQRSSSQGGQFSTISGATTSSYTPAAADVGSYLRLAVTATSSNGYGTSYSVSAYSNPVGPIYDAGTTMTGTTGASSPDGSPISSSSGDGKQPGPTMISASRIIATPTVGGWIRIQGGRYGHAGTIRYQFLRCALACVTLHTSNADSYRLVQADAGHFIEIKVSVSGAAGSRPLLTRSWIGPITAPTAGVLTIGPHTRLASWLTILGSTHAPLASVRLLARHAEGSRLTLGALWRHTEIQTCTTATARLLSCTRPMRLHSTRLLSVRVKRNQRLKVIAVLG
ncbi:MAG: hypothetical protein ACP5H2_05375 [Solirubrobacteraceae bacterium]